MSLTTTSDEAVRASKDEKVIKNSLRVSHLERSASYWRLMPRDWRVTVRTGINCSIFVGFTTA